MLCAMYVGSTYYPPKRVRAAAHLPSHTHAAIEEVREKVLALALLVAFRSGGEEDFRHAPPFARPLNSPRGHIIGSVRASSHPQGSDIIPAYPKCAVGEGHANAFSGESEAMMAVSRLPIASRAVG